ncbi:helix-turn-helix domain-containing protein [Kallotenue papyrolyticum]|uniref:helix-turn-helix domain-containing protein n=1 Tax=Kallotenue papyrolyticum TaxID=1325125 RepID=UPI000492914D|nr:RodZ domain-containing protein [Kallotenue papyrolyticum]
MSQLGARLREAREARGLTIAEVASETRILPRYLQALEEGDFEQLPGDVYARGFIRNYAQFLDLPADELIQLYRRERGAPTEKIKVVPAAVPPRTRSCLLPSAFFTFFSILVLLGVLYWIANLAGLTRMPEVAQQPTPTLTVVPPTPFPTVTLPPEGTPPSPLPPTPTPVVTPTSVVIPAEQLDAPLVVVLRVAPNATRGSWMSVSVDGQPAFTGTLLANNSTQPFKAQREVFVHVGDASVVELIVNGKSEGMMGTVPGGVAKRTIYAPNQSGSTP